MTTPSGPLVTVYIPTCNRRDLLERAVQSVLCQTYLNVELIIVDDASTDDTGLYLDLLSATNANVRIHINEVRSGACISRNVAISMARGLYITGLDDDDFFTPDRVLNFVKETRSLDRHVALYTNAVIEKPNNRINTSRPIKATLIRLLRCNCVGNQIFTKTQTLRDLGGFDPALKAWQDLDCWISLICKSEMSMKRIPGHTYVVDMCHPHERISSGKLSNIQQAYEYIAVKHRLDSKRREILRAQIFPYQQEPRSHREVMLHFFRTGDLSSTARLLKQIITDRASRDHN